MNKTGTFWVQWMITFFPQVLFGNSFFRSSHFPLLLQHTPSYTAQGVTTQNTVMVTEHYFTCKLTIAAHQGKENTFISL